MGIEAKKKLKENFEECFEKKIEDVLSEEGLGKFWSDETPDDEAEAMLTGAAIMMAMGTLPDIMVIARCKVPCDKYEPREEAEAAKEGKAKAPYRIMNKPLMHVYDEEFETVKAANERIEHEVRTSSLTIDDLTVIKVCE